MTDRWWLPLLSWSRLLAIATANAMLWRHEDFRALLCLCLWIGITVEYHAVQRRAPSTGGTPA